jgi:hypothetical protein
MSRVSPTTLSLEKSGASTTGPDIVKLLIYRFIPQNRRYWLSKKHHISGPFQPIGRSPSL